jgi:hypothetical protein
MGRTFPVWILLAWLTAVPCVQAQTDDLITDRRGRNESLDAVASGSRTLGVGPAERLGRGAGETAMTISTLPFDFSWMSDLTNACEGPPYNDAFFAFTAPADGNYQFDMRNPAVDPFMRIWLSGTCCDGRSRVSSDSCGMLPSYPEMHLFLSADQLIYIECGHLSPHTQPAYCELHVNQITLPATSDTCSGAISLSVPAHVVGLTCQATSETVPACGSTSLPASPGVWYRVVGNNHVLTASVCNDSTTFDTQISVFRGSCNHLVCVAGNNDGPLICGRQSVVSWCSQMDIAYYILVNGTAGAAGQFVLTLQQETQLCQDTCVTTAYCGTPTELEPNGACAPPTNQTVLNQTIRAYGSLCSSSDVDYWRIQPSSHDFMHIKVYDGDDCQTYPPLCVTSILYDNYCSPVSNSGRNDWLVRAYSANYLKVYSPMGCVTNYKIAADMCDHEESTYIIVPGVTHYLWQGNTCCPGYASADVVFENACQGSQRTIQYRRLYRFSVAQPTTMTITVSGQDPLLGVFTLSLFSCRASCDTAHGTTEILRNLTLPTGFYYILIGEHDYQCGPMSLEVEADHFLPVELLSFSAVGGDGMVTLRWQSASESGADHYEIERDGQLTARVAAANNASGSSYAWSDESVENGQRYRYTLYSVDIDGSRDSLRSTEATPAAIAQAVITEYALYPNYPNPFNPSTNIAFDLLEGGTTTLSVYNLLGQRVAVALNAAMNPGHHAVTFDGRDLPSGVYLACLSVNGFRAERKMLLMK